MRGQPRPEKFLTPDIGKFGYHRIFLSKNKSSKRLLIHRIVAIHFIKKIKGKDFVNHKNGIKSDNSYLNLEWVTRSENTLHGYRERLLNREGSKNCSAKLKEEDIPTIRNLNMAGKNLKYISNKFGVSENAIYKILNGSRWIHV